MVKLVLYEWQEKAIKNGMNLRKKLCKKSTTLYIWVVFFVFNLFLFLSLLCFVLSTLQVHYTIYHLRIFSPFSDKIEQLELISVLKLWFEFQKHFFKKIIKKQNLKNAKITKSF